MVPLGRLHDRTGERIGRLVVLHRGDNIVTADGRSRAQYVCRCDCGNIIIVLADNLKRTRSCGCLKKEAAKVVGSDNIKHGDTKANRRTRLYRIWSGMKSRCYNERCFEYSRYGGRGIKICSEWLNDYENFKNWANANGYSDDLSIDRIDGNKGYSPENCRWATRKEQQNNLSTNRIVQYNGERYTVAQLSEKYNVSHDKLLKKLNSGCSAEELIRFAERMCANEK